MPHSVSFLSCLSCKQEIVLFQLRDDSSKNILKIIFPASQTTVSSESVRWPIHHLHGVTILSVPGLCLREPDFKLSCDMAVLLGMPLKTIKVLSLRERRQHTRNWKRVHWTWFPIQDFLLVLNRIPEIHVKRNGRYLCHSLPNWKQFRTENKILYFPVSVMNSSLHGLSPTMWWQGHRLLEESFSSRSASRTHLAVSLK